jgi:hypothetical protein
VRGSVEDPRVAELLIGVFGDPNELAEGAHSLRGPVALGELTDDATGERDEFLFAEAQSHEAGFDRVRACEIQTLNVSLVRSDLRKHVVATGALR